MVGWIIKSLLMDVIEPLCLMPTLAHHNAQQDRSDECEDNTPRLYLTYNGFLRRVHLYFKTYIVIEALLIILATLS